MHPLSSTKQQSAWSRLPCRLVLGMIGCGVPIRLYLRGACLAVMWATVASIVPASWPAVAEAQNKTEKKAKTATAKKAKGADEEEAPESPLVEIDFGAVPAKQPEGDTPLELDATDEGKERLATLGDSVRDIFLERDRLEAQRRPLALLRDRVVGEVNLLNQGIVSAQQGIIQRQNQLRNLQRQRNNGGNNELTNNQIAALEEQIFMANSLIADNQAQIAERSPDILAFNQQIQPLDARLLKLWLQLNDSRKQWLELRQPQIKYAHGNFEDLKRAIDDWVLIDGLWPEAFCWAALSNYELGNYEAAWDSVDRAAELRKTLMFPKAWAQGEALRGLIAARIPERRTKSAGHLQTAQVYANKDRNTKWEVFFLIGRAAVENDKLAVKARTNFEKALKINADASCVKFWYAHLQSSSTTATVRDVPAGTKTFEELWKHSTKQSWRLAQELVLAYDAADRKAEADQTWEVVETLVPKLKLEELQEARAAARNQDATEKSKTTSATKRNTK